MDGYFSKAFATWKKLVLISRVITINGTKKEVNVIPDVQVSLYFNSITAVFCIL